MFKQQMVFSASDNSTHITEKAAAAHEVGLFEARFGAKFSKEGIIFPHSTAIIVPWGLLAKIKKIYELANSGDISLKVELNDRVKLRADAKTIDPRWTRNNWDHNGLEECVGEVGEVYDINRKEALICFDSGNEVYLPIKLLQVVSKVAVVEEEDEEDF